METLFSFFFLLPLLVLLFIIFVREVKQYQRGILLTMGKFSRIVQPGWKIIVPVFQKMTIMDIRVKAVDVPDQEAVTKDNVSCGINAVIYYKIKDVSKAFLEVENVWYAVTQLAQTTMRNVVGEVDLDQLLSNRNKISEKIRLIVDEATDPWGLDVSSVELKDVTLPDTMKRTIAKQAEAERERRAVIIKAEGELQASNNLQEAARKLAEAPGALHLRTLQSINDISSDQSNTTVWMVPVEVLRALESVKGYFDKKQS